MESTKSNNIRQTIYLVMIIIWMSIIFIFSAQPGYESTNTSSTTSKLVVNIITKKSDMAVEKKEEITKKIQPIMRKVAHYTLYTLGGMLILNYVRKYCIDDSKKILISIIIGATYALTDEFHQSFVDGRTSAITDVWIDTMGVATGVCIFLCVIKVVNIVTKK